MSFCLNVRMDNLMRQTVPHASFVPYLSTVPVSVKHMTG